MTSTEGAMSSSSLPSSSSSSLSSSASASVVSNQYYFMGFDLGTSGARISVIQKNIHPTALQQTNVISYKEMHSDSVTYESSYDDPTNWVTAVDTLLQRTPINLRSRTLSICVSGTSASCLLVDSRTGLPSRDGGRRAKMYNYDVYNADTAGGKVRQWLDQDQNKDQNGHGHGHGHGHGQLVPANHVVRSSTSALAKLLHYHASQPIQSFEVLAHQSEYVASTVFISPTTSTTTASTTTTTTTGVKEYVSDWHNALKLGYDVKTLQYPPWLLQFLQQDDIGIPSSSSSSCTYCGVLPRVVEPGQPIGPVSKKARDRYGFSEDTMVVGGTTDSNASFLAAALGGGSENSSVSSSSISSSNHPSFGTAVTSLGSTLAIKMLSRTFVEDCERGVYSHRFPSFVGGGKDADASADACTTDKPSSSQSSSPPLWLVGGASNVGCAVLRQENFTNQELMELSSDMDITTDCDSSYYPLTKKGERFPIADGSKEPILEPKPKSGSRQDYLKAILQGISKVERMGYDTLGMLGASPPFPKVIMTTGGGSKNEKWMQMRQRLLQSQDSSLLESSSSSPSSLSSSRVVMVGKAENTEASFGAAILAAAQFVSSTSV